MYFTRIFGYFSDAEYRTKLDIFYGIENFLLNKVRKLNSYRALFASTFMQGAANQWPDVHVFSLKNDHGQVLGMCLAELNPETNVAM